MKCEMKCPSGSEPRIEITEEFIKNNNLIINLDNVKKLLEEEFFGYAQDVAVKFLTFEEAKPYLTERYITNVENGRKEYKQITDVNEAAQDFLDYMVFTWWQAMDERRHPTNHSLKILSAWMKILGRNDVVEILSNDSLYNPYGRPALKRACEILGINFPSYL